MVVSFFPMPNRCVMSGILLLAVTGGLLYAQEARYEFAQVHMGMEVRLVLYSGEASVARAAAAAAFDRIRKLEDTMSDYRDESEVRRLARRPGEWVPVSPDLYAVIKEALDLAEASVGAFDPTVGPLVAFWRTARRTGRLPPAESLQTTRERVGWQWVELDSVRRAIRLVKPGMALDLGGIAKGYILDRALESIRASGVTRALLIAGGDIVAGEPPPGLEGWSIATEGAGEELQRRASALANAALSTSGDSEQFVVIGGVRYSHVIDPRTGTALTNRLRAYVIAPSGARADGLATAATVASQRELEALKAGNPDALIDAVSITSDSSSIPGSHPPRSVPSSGPTRPR
jgi:thiamine biosynthesis lipoprotein